MRPRTRIEILRRQRARRGQTLVVALAILFVLLFIGGLFVAQIARNLAAAGRNKETGSAQAFAIAGINYCDNLLSNSEDGADWRPVPSPPLTAPNDPQGVTDPDYFWLNQGFTRVNANGGRYLVRVTYDPRPNDPNSQFIKIEAVGRSGDLGGGLDPTVFVQQGAAPRLRGEQIAYKQIGVTDYLRFVTNKDRRVSAAYLGTPNIGHNVATVYGDPTIAAHPDGANNGELLIGSPMRIQSDLTVGGDTFFYFSPRFAAQPGIGGADPQLSPEHLLITGSINLQATRPGGNPQAFVNQDITSTTPSVGNALRASADPLFSTIFGYIRDGLNKPDVAGYTRGNPRIEPAVLNGYAGGTGILRYRLLTRDSGVWGNVGGTRYNTGQNGWGRGIYLNNPRDLQSETTGGGQTGNSLPEEWLNRTGTNALADWNGPLYTPPGIEVELLGNRIRLTRSDPGGIFYNPDGTPSTLAGGKVIEIPLTDYDRKNFKLPNGTTFPLPIFSHDGDEPSANSPFADKNSYGVSVVLYAEGNVRVRGLYGAVTDPAVTTESGDADSANPVRKLGRVHLTIVSGGTAYIEGSVLKGDGALSGGKVSLGRESTCFIGAKDYVCVNTTRFMSPQNQTNPYQESTEGLNDFYLTLGISNSSNSYDTSFAWGVPPSTYGSAYLLVRQSVQETNPAFYNLLTNPALDNSGSGANSLYAFNLLPAPAFYTYPVGQKLLNVGGTQQLTDDPTEQGGRFDMLGLPLPNPTGSMITSPGYENLLRFQIDRTNASLFSAGGSADLLFGTPAIVPMDVRIEAALYAQERSFFIIPGYGFNPDGADTRESYNVRGARTSYGLNDTQGARDVKNLAPFHNEPMDVRITLFGAITENYTATEGQQAEWMRRWGWIPRKHGSSNIDIPADHLMAHDAAIGTDPNYNAYRYNPGEDRNTDFRTPYERATTGGDVEMTRGLRFEYDPALALPYQHPTEVAFWSGASGFDPRPDGRAQRALRHLTRKVYDYQGNPLATFQQTLPSLPRLPVCPGLLYAGDPDRPIGE